MYLLIDPSENNKIHLALFDEKVIEHKYYSRRNREILVCIDKLFSGKGIRNKEKGVKNIEGIMVVVGAGGFTSTRVACVVANTFAYVQQIPLLSIKVEELEKIQKLIPKLLKQKAGHYLSATYSAEPNIGKKI
jgi:tRNA A37 threonylcarbamoyladenosine modification protein TsaB